MFPSGVFSVAQGQQRASPARSLLGFGWRSLAPARFPGGSVAKNLPPMQETGVQSLGWEDPLGKGMVTLELLPGESHGQRRLAGYGPWGHKESDMTEGT